MKENIGKSPVLTTYSDKDKTKNYLSIESLGSSNAILMEGVFDLAKIALWEWNVSTDEFRGTKQLYDIFNINPGEYGNSLIASLKALVCPEYQDYVKKTLNTFLKNKSINNFKFKIILKDGQERWVIVKGRIELDGNMAVGMIMDCSHTENTEISLNRDLDFIQTMVDAIPNPIYSKNTQEVYQFCNVAFAQMNGTTIENIIGRTSYDIYEFERANIYHQKDIELIQSGCTQTYEEKVHVFSGEDRTYRFHKAMYKNIPGAMEGFVGVMTDLSEIISLNENYQRLIAVRDIMLEISQVAINFKDAETLLEVLMSMALKMMPHADAASVLILGSDGYFRLISIKDYKEEKRASFKIKAEDAFEYRATDGRLGDAIIINDIPERVLDGCVEPLETKCGSPILSCISTPISVEGVRLALINVDSAHNDVFVQDDLDLMNYMKAQVEMALTNLKLHKDTARLSQEDALTGAMNRGYFERTFETYLKSVGAFDQCLSLIVSDIDGLKAINDSLGHAEGDLRIQQFVKSFHIIMIEGDLLGRYGGDEFVAVFFGKTRKLTESILTEFQDGMGADSDVVSFSFGVAEFPLEGQSYLELVRIADKRMYQSKQQKSYRRRQQDNKN